MEIQTITIKSDKGTTAILPIRFAAGPIIVHRPGFNGDLVRGWHVTHKTSGLRLASVPSIAVAKQLATALATIGDWSFTTRETCSAETKAAAWEIVKDHQGGK